MADRGLYHPRERNCGSTASEACTGFQRASETWLLGSAAFSIGWVVPSASLCSWGTMVFVNAVTDGKPNASGYVFIGFCTAVPWVIGRALRYILAGE